MESTYYAFILLLGYAAACSHPGAPAHSWITFSSKSLQAGTDATYSCERGFELLGPSKRTCSADGKWIPEGVPFCVLNVAAGKAAMQVSTEDGGVPQRALDGSTSHIFNAETCSLTRAEPVPWWYVNLLEPYMVQLVRLDFGKPCCGNDKAAVVVVRVGNNRPDLATNPVCNRYTGYIDGGQPLFLPCNPPMAGAFVSVHLEPMDGANPDPAQLSICEAFVYTDQALPVERCPQFRDQAPGSTATYNGKCYIFYNTQPVLFSEAMELCRKRGGTLVDESGPALQGFISWELWRRHRSDGSRYWMGAVSDPRDASWKWTSGDDVVVSFWNSPEPKSDQQTCAQYDGANGWLWSAADCGTEASYICQHQPKTCGRPEQPPNSVMVSRMSGFNVGAVIEYGCDAGFLLVGPRHRTCRDTGFYDQFPPVCKKLECGFPAVIAHGTYSLLNGTVSYLAHVQYTCKAGYEMVGRARLVCDIDERWNGPPPKCEEVMCTAPPEVENGRVRTTGRNTKLGAVVEYVCTLGHRLHGPSAVECLPTGAWSQLPKCIVDTLTTATTTSTSTSAKTPTSPSTPRASLSTLRASSSTPRASSSTPRASSSTIRASPSTPRTVARQPVSWPTPTAFTAAPKTESPPPAESSPRPDTERTPPSILLNRIHDAQSSHTSSPHIIVASRPADNHKLEESHPEVTNKEPTVAVASAQLNMGAIVALAVFGVMVFVIAVIVTIVLLCKSRVGGGNGSDGRRVDSYGTAGSSASSAESRAGLTRSYNEAWDQLQDLAYRNRGVPPPFAKSAAQKRIAYRSRTAQVPSNVTVATVEQQRHHHHHHRHHASEETRLRRGSNGVEQRARF